MSMKCNKSFKLLLCLVLSFVFMFGNALFIKAEDFDEVVKLDLKYIDNWSLTEDFKILLQTVGVVLFGKGAK